MQIVNLIRAVGSVFILAVLLPGCASYPRDIFWENKIKSTPYEASRLIVNPQRWDDSAITYAWLGHATVLINFRGTLILTDPVLHDRIGPPEIFDNMFGIKRLVQLPVSSEDIPEIDLILISHSHYDHLDLPSLYSLREKSDYHLIVPALTTELFDEEFADIVELDWLDRADESSTVNDIKVTAFRVEHYGYVDWGGRDVRRGFNGYLLSTKDSSHHIAFFGDTSYSRYRDETGGVLDKPVSINWREKFAPEILQSGIDLCIIPIGDSYYYWNHISPENAVRLSRELNCKKMLPIHYATFLLTPPEKEPVTSKQGLLKTLKDRHDLNLVRCRTMQGNIEFPQIGTGCILQLNRLE